MASDQLSAYLAAVTGKTWQWSRVDCLMWLADWATIRTGRDPAVGWRGTYRTRREAEAILDRRGGIIAHVEACIIPLGWRLTDAPDRGDIGLVRVPAIGDGEQLVEAMVGAICLGPTLWAVKPAFGGDIAAGEFPVARAWSYHG